MATPERQSSDALINPSEKIDGTCSYVQVWNEKPWLWARLIKRKSEHENWMKAVNGRENTHIGWVPVLEKSAYPWHHSTFHAESARGLVLLPVDEQTCELTTKPLESLLNQTVELIGTKINGNPYKLGDLKTPFHVLVPHGAFPVKNLPGECTFEEMRTWMETQHIEGIVWNGQYKLTRRHLNLKWPLKSTSLMRRSITVHGVTFGPLKDLNGRSFSSLEDFNKCVTSLNSNHLSAKYENSCFALEPEPELN